MKVTKEKYLGANKANQLDMLWYLINNIHRKINLFILLGISLLAFIKWG